MQHNVRTLKMTCPVPTDEELIRQTMPIVAATGELGSLESLLAVAQRRRRQLDQWGYWVLHVSSRVLLTKYLAMGAELVTSKDLT